MEKQKYYTISVTKEVREALDNYMFENRILKRSVAAKEVIELGIETANKLKGKSPVSNAG